MNQNTTPTQTSQREEIGERVPKEEVEKANYMGNSKLQMLKFQDFWFFPRMLNAILTFQTQFHAQDTDLVLASFPKTGTTWLKSLLFSIVNRSLYRLSQSPLLSHNPHDLVYDLETGVYGGNLKYPNAHQLQVLPSPRLLHSHLSYTLLPESIKTSECKILYICRNPFDTLVSHWYFIPNVFKRLTGDENFQPPNIEDFLEDFCQGKVLFGPFFEHVVGYWKKSLEQPNKVLFLKYEDLKENPDFYVKKLANFVGRPFSQQEEDEGVIKEIIDMCSIQNLKELEVNKSGFHNRFVENKTFFRDGQVGGWTRHFTTFMVEKMNKLMEEKLEGTGLCFKLQFK